MIEKCREAVSFIKKQMPANFTPKVGIVLGSGLGHYGTTLKAAVNIKFSDIPHFCPTTIEGHEGKLITGMVGKVPVVVMQGRIHAYEGHDLHQVTFPIRVMKELGITHIFITNAAGSINENFKPGTIVAIADHINLTGKNALVGKNAIELGPRFPDMTEGYSKELIEIMTKAALDLGFAMPTGIYCGVLGPSYETPAEIKMMRIIGGDLVGMSTVQEVIVANHAGLKVAGISCITNLAAGLSRDKLNHEEVKREAAKINEKITHLINKSIEALKF